MNKQGIVISVSLSTQVKKQAGGTYEAWELVYKSQDGKVESFQKPVQGLKFNPSLRDQLAALQPGDEFTATLEKNAGGFWEVQSVTKGVAETSNGSAVRGGPAQAAGKVTGSNYETPTERAARQVSIVRQSSLAQAVATLAAGAKAAPKVEDVLELAQVYVNFVNNVDAGVGVDDGIVY